MRKYFISIAPVFGVFVDATASAAARQRWPSDVFNALLYINRTGIPWKYLPHDFPNHGSVYAYYAAWRDESGRWSDSARA